jgi:hypothetical protein
MRTRAGLLAVVAAFAVAKGDNNNNNNNKDQFRKSINEYFKTT